jgi:hypothetical protein
MKDPISKSTAKPALREVPLVERAAIAESVLQALTQSLAEEGADMISRFPSVRIKTPLCEQSRAYRLKLHGQIMKGNGASRLARVLESATPPLENDYCREHWIIRHWTPDLFPDMPQIFRNLDDSIGLSDLTDETALAVISHSLTAEMSLDSFRNFRTKFGLLQVSRKFRISGIVVNGKLKPIRIGKRSL